MSSRSDSAMDIDENGVLCSILSYLPLKEAARTFAVSHRWKNIWNYLPVLQFDIKNIFSDEIRRRFISLITREEQTERIVDTSSRLNEINEDGILCSILSYLPLKEAVRTSAVSPRWKNIWNYLPVLKFDVKNIFSDEILLRLNSLTTVQEKQEFLCGVFGQTEHFIHTVNSVVKQHRGIVDSFRVAFFLNKKHTHHIDAWIKFAVASKTKKLSILLGDTSTAVDLYNFPFHLLASSSINVLFLSFCSVQPPRAFDGLSHLKILNIWNTNVTEDNIEHLLSNCSSLSRLTLVNLKGSRIVRIPHSLIQLRELIVKDCADLTRIEINVVNLSFMDYAGFPVDFIIEQSSQLLRARLHLKTEGKGHSFNSYLDELARKFSHLYVLFLNVSGVSKPCSVKDVPTFCFGHLKRLDWECPDWSIGVKMRLLHLTTLLNAAPFLIDLRLTLSMGKEEEQPPERLTKLINGLPSNPHSHLKIVKIDGFYFERWQLQIVLYLLKNAAELVSMTLEKGWKQTGRRPYREISETDIHKLTQEVPAYVKFMIL